MKNHTDCNGVCFGTAKINKCGECVLGNTGKVENEGKDLLPFDIMELPKALNLFSVFC